MFWLKRFNFIETAKLEMELMKAFEEGDDLDEKVNTQLKLAQQSGDAEEKWKALIWKKMLVRIRKMEKLMKGKVNPKS